MDEQRRLRRRDRMRNAAGHDDEGEDDDFDWLPWFFRGAVDSYRDARYDGILDVLPLPRTTVAPFAYLETETGEGGGLAPLSPENLAARRPEAAVDSIGGGGTAAAGTTGTTAKSFLYYTWDGDGLDAPPPMPALRQDWSRWVVRNGVSYVRASVLCCVVCALCVYMFVCVRVCVCASDAQKWGPAAQMGMAGDGPQTQGRRGA